jgi:hypothetical protein
MKQWKLLKTEEQKAEFRRQRREKYNNMTPEQRTKWNNHRKTYRQIWLNNLTPEEVQEYRSMIRKNWEAFAERLSPERKAEIKQTIKENSRKKYANLPKLIKQKRNHIQKQYLQNLSPEEIERRKIIAAEKASAKALRIKTKVVAYYSNGNMRCMNPKCEVIGGATNIKGLCVDHINGRGGQEMKRLGMKGGTKFYLYLVRKGFPPGYQILCGSCNIIKVQENKENRFRYQKEESTIT